jgi:ferric-dicitrate binding protein FerR (iron transport regulator)
LKGAPREVFLDGEAFFEVSEDKKRPFIVQANGLNTRVYGTKFNVNSYKNDDIEEVVLLEGSVGIKLIGKQPSIAEELLLKPNEMASLDRTGKIHMQSIDVESHVAWIDGVLMFENERLEDVFKKLERHFDVSIKNNYTVINDNRYTGIFDEENIEEILKIFSKIKPFIYTINKKEIIINP